MYASVDTYLNTSVCWTQQIQRSVHIHTQYPLVLVIIIVRLVRSILLHFLVVHVMYFVILSKPYLLIERGEQVHLYILF